MGKDTKLKFLKMWLTKSEGKLKDVKEGEKLSYISFVTKVNEGLISDKLGEAKIFYLGDLVKNSKVCADILVLKFKEEDSNKVLKEYTLEEVYELVGDSISFVWIPKSK